jgi:hypothetical protein
MFGLVDRSTFCGDGVSVKLIKLVIGLVGDFDTKLIKLFMGLEGCLKLLEFLDMDKIFQYIQTVMISLFQLFYISLSLILHIHLFSTIDVYQWFHHTTTNMLNTKRIIYGPKLIDIIPKIIDNTIFICIIQ